MVIESVSFLLKSVVFLLLNIQGHWKSQVLAGIWPILHRKGGWVCLKDRWITWDFMSFSKVFQSYQDDGRVEEFAMEPYL